MFKPVALAFVSSLLLSACGGNPFIDTPVDPTDPTDPKATVTVDPKVAVDLRAITYDPSGGGALRVDLDGLVGSTQNVEFVRDAARDIEGYQAFTYQERSTQRSYIALVADNPAATGRSTLRAAAVSDGGQFNRHFGGGTFARIDLYSAPTGQFSYAGTYAGVFAPGDASSDLPDGLVANTPYRVQGDALINANFINSKVDGGVDNRWLLDAAGDRIDLNADGLVNDDDKLGDITFPVMDITANGQFLGDVEFSIAPQVPPGSTVIGSVNGVFGGLQASDVAGALVINPIGGLGGTWEHGVFNLPQCGTAGESPLCNPGAP